MFAAGRPWAPRANTWLTQFSLPLAWDGGPPLSEVLAQTHDCPDNQPPATFLPPQALCTFWKLPRKVGLSQGHSGSSLSFPQLSCNV